VLRRSTGGRERASLLAGGWASASDASGDGVDRRQRIMASDMGRVAFLVAGQAPVVGEPGEDALDRPPAGDHGEPMLPGGLAHEVSSRTGLAPSRSCTPAVKPRRSAADPGCR
jgi:hypothetical protein